MGVGRDVPINFHEFEAHNPPVADLPRPYDPSALSRGTFRREANLDFTCRPSGQFFVDNDTKPAGARV